MKDAGIVLDEAYWGVWHVKRRREGAYVRPWVEFYDQEVWVLKLFDISHSTYGVKYLQNKRLFLCRAWMMKMVVMEAEELKKRSNHFTFYLRSK